MGEYWFISLAGLLICAAGIFLFIRDKRLFRESVNTVATVVSYDVEERILSREEQEQIRKGEAERELIYTMVVEYALEDGRVIQTRQNGSSSAKKYQPGTKLPVTYSKSKPHAFYVQGDAARKVLPPVLAVVGIVMIIAPFFMG